MPWSGRLASGLAAQRSRSGSSTGTVCPHRCRRRLAAPTVAGPRWLALRRALGRMPASPQAPASHPPRQGTWHSVRIRGFTPTSLWAAWAGKGDSPPCCRCGVWPQRRLCLLGGSRWTQCSCRENAPPTPPTSAVLVSPLTAAVRGPKTRRLGSHVTGRPQQRSAAPWGPGV